MMTEAQQHHRMTTHPVWKLICRLAVPTVISMLVTSVYNMADTYFVSRLGTSATGAVGVVFSLMAIIQAIGFTLGMGAGNVVSRLLGEKKIDEAQRILGKMFNPSDVNIMVGMLDYLGMNEECILLLLAHCKKIGKSNLRTIEKFAYTLVDKGINDVEAMEAEICAMEAMYTFEGEVRALFGMKTRAMTSKESKMLSAWLSFGYDISIVRMAYEITVNATGEASLPYTNAILEKWNANGWKTAAEIEAGMNAEREKRENAANKKELGNSFDTDDFFEAALQRGFRERSRE